MVKTLCLLTLALVAFACSAAVPPSIALSVEPDPPPPNESFTLIFKADGAVDADPDFAPLAQDFEVLGRNQQTSLQIVNGRPSRSTVWMLSVLPKRAGPLTVPAIHFGTEATAPRTIEFANAKATASATDDGLFLEVDAQPRAPYVQQQVIYRLRLWRRYEISNATLSEPELTADAIVKPIEDDRRYEETRDGKHYEVIERSFAVFPQQSGTVTIKPAVVTAQVVKRGFSLFDNFSQPVATKRVVSESIDLTVKPVPASFPGRTWLPAKQVSIHEDWLPESRSGNVGEPITRTVNLWADGLTAGQLPPLEIPPTDGIKLYPDRPQTSEQQNKTGYSAVLQRKTALIPVTAGEIKLPAIEIPWWNTETDRLELARLPAVSLDSKAVPGAAAPPPVTNAPPGIVSTVPAPTLTKPKTAPVADNDIWRWIALTTSIGWGLTLIVWWLVPGRERSANAAPRSENSATASSVAVRQSFAGRQPAEIAAALLSWAAVQWTSTPPRSLAALAARVDPGFAAALWQLDHHLYRSADAELDLAALEAAWSNHMKANRASPHTGRTVLPALYAGGT